MNIELVMPSVADSDEIQSYRLYAHRNFLLHGYAIPFIPAYSAILYQLSGILTEQGEESLVSLVFKLELELPLAFLMLTLVSQILLCLSCVWSVHIRCIVTCSSVSSVDSASLVKVVPTANNGSVVLTQLLNREGQVWFEFQKIRYIYNTPTNTFSPPSLEENTDFGSYLSSAGLSSAEVRRREKLFGSCALSIELPLFSQLFRERATAPFFVFQLFCVLMWCLDEYWHYALFTIFMLVSLECMVVFQQRRNLSSVRDMITEPGSVTACRDGKWGQVPSDRLVPGDLVSLSVTRRELVSPCDALLLHGAIVADEAMLTGESIPRHKESVSGRAETESFSFERDARQHVLFSGTKLLQTEPAPKGCTPLRPPNGGAIAYVLRTGFNTSQGRLVRTILYGVERVTANNKEALMFLVFLMHFAVMAAVYVWVHGTEDPLRSRYKLFLQCTFIVTTVVPPELPIILSLAVNNSLLSLVKSKIFCTEPFRLPNAGKLDFCCFDKTGTLTSSDIAFLGVTNATRELSSQLAAPGLRANETQLVIGLCHSLASVRKGEIIGDPLEIAAFSAAGWTLGKENKPQLPKSLKVSGSFSVARKFHFNSTDKRMTVICINKSRSLALTRGAPETVRALLSSVPDGYDRVHHELVCLGARVLALAYRDIPSSVRIFSSLSREEAERGMHFCGFICFSSAVKPDSKSSVRALRRSSHRLMMITGDNPYTACYVSHELSMSSMSSTLMLARAAGGWEWASPDRTVRLGLEGLEQMRALSRRHELCVTGEGVSHLCGQLCSEAWVQYVRIFARMSPKQKEQVVLSLNRRHYTLMCGDGSNDVGALKHAHIGVSLLSRPPGPGDPQPPKQGRGGETEAPPPVQLGDASIASPFTSRSDSVAAVCNIVRHGRCTLVTILQMYKIIAISALISAYSQSALYLDGIKFSDMQALLQGVFVSFSFMIFSRIRPLSELSKEKPIPNVFNLYTLGTVFLQSSVHLASIVILVRAAKLITPITDAVDDLDAEFKPSILNTTVFLISLCMQLSTCTINYRGRPFIPSLYENKLLLALLSIGYTTLFALSLGYPADFCDKMEILILPDELRTYLLQVIAVDIVASLLLDYVLLFLYRKFWLS